MPFGILDLRTEGPAATPCRGRASYEGSRAGPPKRRGVRAGACVGPERGAGARRERPRERRPSDC